MVVVVEDVVLGVVVVEVVVEGVVVILVVVLRRFSFLCCVQRNIDLCRILCYCYSRPIARAEL